MVQRNGVRWPNRQNAKETKVHLEAMLLRMKPEANKGLHLTPRITVLYIDAFEPGSTLKTKIHAYLVRKMNLAENEGEKSVEFIDWMSQITLEAFWTQNVRAEEGFQRTYSMLEGLGAGGTASFLAKIYPVLSHYLIQKFLKAITGLSIVVILGLFGTFGAKNFIKVPAVLLTEGIQSLRLDGLLTLIAITHGKLVGLIKLTRYPEQMKENVRNFDKKEPTGTLAYEHKQPLIAE